MTSDYFPVHAHTAFSGMDGMGTVQEHVDRVAELGQPGLIFTEHGNMGGTVQAYKACRKAGIAYYPGSEFYLVKDVTDPDTRGDAKKAAAGRYHLGLAALDYTGYQALTKLQTLSWSESRFHYKPLIDLTDLAFLHDEGLAEHLALFTGCYSGLVVDGWMDKHGDCAPANAQNMIRMLANWFPNTYVELQNHGIDWPAGYSDIDIAGELFDIAKDMGLPVVIGGDSHYVRPGQQVFRHFRGGVHAGGRGQ